MASRQQGACPSVQQGQSHCMEAGVAQTRQPNQAWRTTPTPGGEKDYMPPPCRPRSAPSVAGRRAEHSERVARSPWTCMRRSVTAGSGCREMRIERARAAAAKGSASQPGADARYAAERWARRLSENEASVYISRSLAAGRSSRPGHPGPPNSAGSARRALDLRLGRPRTIR